MLLSLPEFEYVTCQTIEEACSHLSAEPGRAKLFAGGTDLLVRMKHRRATPSKLINIKKIPELSYIRYDNEAGLAVGALATAQEIAGSSLVAKRFSVLAQAAGLLGTPHVRTMATLGGNLGNASPAAEFAPALLTLGATLRIAGPGKEREVAIDSFFTGPGRSVLGDDEMVTEIRVPNQADNTRGVHIKYGSRRVDVAIAGASLLVTMNDRQCSDIKIALSSVGPIPFRARKAEDVIRDESFDRSREDLIEEAARTASEESSPIDDIRGTADYRRQLVRTLVKDGLNRLITEAAL